jgi:hypothetical protein
MTTTITVKASSWPVQVAALDTKKDGNIAVRESTILGHLEPGTSGDFHVTDTRQLLVTELPLDAVLPAATQILTA